MKFIQIVLMLLMINLSITIVNHLELVQLPETINKVYGTTAIQSQEKVNFGTDQSTISDEDSDSLAYKIESFNQDDYYSSGGIVTTVQQELSAVGNFVKGLKMMEVIIVGTVLIYPTFKAFLPPEVYPYIFFYVIPIYFMYLLALIQFISNRNLGDLK